MIFIAALLIASSLVVAGAAAKPAAQYVLKHPKREHCKVHYVKRVKTVRVTTHGHVRKIKKTFCVYVPPKSSAPATPAPAPSSTPGTGHTCSAWNITGSWTWEAALASAILSGTASLYQSGSTVTGTLQSGPITWTLEGTISGSAVTLNMKANGQIENKWSGTVTAGGTEIQQSGSATEGGNFVKGHATCTG
ncbi:MAG TPA: hypothetical protein VNZ05_07070 [Solirubrobacteraceae bacterium]|nr:hypothetical protein [Solirubrobacteraceae bacterium]